LAQRVGERIHGQDRGGELRDCYCSRTARVASISGEITAYAPTIDSSGMRSPETNHGHKGPLIGAASAFRRRVLVPTRKWAELFRGVSTTAADVHQMTLMTIGSITSRWAAARICRTVVL